MGLFDFWKKPAKFAPTNALEVMFERGEAETNSRAFFALIASRKVFALTPIPEEIGDITVPAGGRKLSLETTVPIDGVRYAYVFTSSEAMHFALYTARAQERGFVELEARVLMASLIHAGHGINLNAGQGRITLCGPHHLQFILDLTATSRRGLNQRDKRPNPSPPSRLLD